MAIDQIRRYIQEKKQKGESNEKIRADLSSVGWGKEEIEKAFIQALNPDIPVPQMPPESIVLTDSKMSVNAYHNLWDSFEHILMFISLYILVGSLAFMIRFFVDKWYPAPLGTTQAYDYNSVSSNGTVDPLNLIFYYMAAIIVSYPIFAFLSHRISKRTKSNPLIRTLMTRRILFYVTLTISLLAMLLGLIIIISNFLRGSIHPNRVLHSLVTFGIGGIIFSCYFIETREDKKTV